jgi:hypothetical protein
LARGGKVLGVIQISKITKIKFKMANLEKWNIHISSLGAGSQIRCQSSVDEFTLWVSQRPEDLSVENFQALYAYVCGVRVYMKKRSLKLRQFLPNYRM